MVSNLESVLREGLLRSDRAVAGIPSLLELALEGTGQALINEAIIARITGMLRDIAAQLAQDVEEPAARSLLIRTLGDMLPREGELLACLHSIALEAQLTQQLSHEAHIEPVMSPLIENCLAFDDQTVVAQAQDLIAAQLSFERFIERAQFSLENLSSSQKGNLFALRNALSAQADAATAPLIGDKAGKDQKDPQGASDARTEALFGLLEAMGNDAKLALDLQKAGFALFVTAIAGFTGQPRQSAVLACHPSQAVRLALSLRAAGLSSDEIQAQFALLEPDRLLPPGFDEVSMDAAADILASSKAPYSG